MRIKLNDFIVHTLITITEIVLSHLFTYHYTSHLQVPFVPSNFHKSTLKGLHVYSMCLFSLRTSDVFLEDIIQKCVDRKGPYWTIWHGQWEESLAQVVLTFRAGSKLRRSHPSARQRSSNITSPLRRVSSSQDSQSAERFSTARDRSRWIWRNGAFQLRKTKSCEKCNLNPYFIWIWNVIRGKCVSSALCTATPLITNVNIKCCSDSEHIVVLNNKANIYIHVQQSYLHGHTRERASTWGVTTKLWCRKKKK